MVNLYVVNAKININVDLILDIYNVVYLAGLNATTAASTIAAPTSSAAYGPACAALRARGQGTITEVSNNGVWVRILWNNGAGYQWWYRLRDIKKSFYVVT